MSGEGFAPLLRASDQDRHEAVLALSEHHAEGRLDLTEFTVRMERAQEAVHLADLDPLFADLPARGRAAVTTTTRRRRFTGRPAIFIVAAVALVVAVSATAGGHLPWWLFVVVAWFVFGPRAQWRHAPYRPPLGARRRW
jgi:DUF1707 SHOCT-like domain